MAIVLVPSIERPSHNFIEREVELAGFGRNARDAEGSS